MLLDIVTETLTAIEADNLAQLEARIERGIQTFVDVGLALMEIRDSEPKLYRATHKTFEDYCRDRWGMVRQHANRLIAAAETVSILEPMGSKIPESERQVRPLMGLDPEQQRQAWAWAVETAPDGKMTGAHVQQVVDGLRNGYQLLNNGVKKCNVCGELWAADLDYCPYCNIPQDKRIEYVTNERSEPEKRPVSYHVSDDSYEWYTPSEYIEAARRTMGGIDLDPATSARAQTVVKAGRFYTKEDDGLSQEWAGRVWLNPPYNMPLIEQFIDKTIGEYESGGIESAVVLTNNSTDTGWFHKLARYPFCLTRGRIRFWGGEDETLATRQGQAIFYLGNDPDSFAAEFSRFGLVVQRYDNQ